MDRFIQFALLAADEAVAQAGWRPEDERGARAHGDDHRLRSRRLSAIGEAVRTVDERGVRRLSPFTVPSFLVNLAAGQISISTALRDRWAPPSRPAPPASRRSAMPPA